MEAMDKRKIIDIFCEKGMFITTSLVLSLIFFIAGGLYLRAMPILKIRPLKELLFSQLWHPLKGEFGLASFIAGTIWVTVIAMIIAIPLSLFTAIFLSEYCRRKVRQYLKPVIDLLAGISPVIYGVWGILVIVPLVRDYLMPYFNKHLSFFPFLSDNYTGYSAVTGGIVLAVMILPIIISIVEEVMNSVPFEMREASLALGATKWQTIKYTVIKKALPGIIAAFILGLSRAFGETMAVLMVAGCDLHGFPRGIFDTAYPLSALIANTYGEMMSIPIYDSAIFLAALILMVLTTCFNMLAWGILLHIDKKVL